MTYQDASPATDAPFTEDEQRVLAANAPQADRFDTGRLEALCAAYAPSNLHGYTRGDQLRHAVVTAALERRRDAEKAARAVLDRLPTLSRGTAGYGLKAHDAVFLDRATAGKIRRMSLTELEAEHSAVMDASHTVRPTREQRSALFHYTRELRELIQFARKKNPSAG